MKKAKFNELVQECLEKTCNLTGDNKVKNWEIELTNSLPMGILGRANFDENKILISKPLTRFGRKIEVEKVLLHEFAHVYVGIEHQHDEVFEKMAEALGGYSKSNQKISVPDIILLPLWKLSVTTICSICFVWIYVEIMLGINKLVG